MAELIVGVDLGTTGTKAAVYSASGDLLAEGGSPVPQYWHGPGKVEQDPEDFYLSAVAAINECLARADIAAEEVAAVGVTGQMAGVLGVDGNFAPSTPYDSWLDLSCSPQIDRLERELGDELLERTGCPPMVNHASKIRWWLEERPEDFSRTWKWVMPGGYVAGRLAGLSAEEAFIDRTYLHFTGLAEAREGTWSERLANSIGVPERQLPRIVEPTTLIGGLTPRAAADSGLAEGTPVAAGLGDTAAGALGAGMVRPGQLLDTAGTAAILAGSSEAFRPDAENRTMIVMRGAIEGQWISLSFLSGGSLLGWFEEAIATGAGTGSSEGPDFEALAAQAERAPAGSAGLIFLPHLDGRLLPNDPSMRGAWVGLNREHRRPHLIRAILEGVAYEYSLYLDALIRLQPDLDLAEARVVGGGARSELWNRIKASVLGVPYARLDREELSCWGAALVAGKAVGLFEDLASSAEGGARVLERWEPEAEDREVYLQMSRMYREVLASVAESSRKLAEFGKATKERAEDFS